MSYWFPRGAPLQPFAPLRGDASTMVTNFTAFKIATFWRLDFFFLRMHFRRMGLHKVILKSIEKCEQGNTMKRPFRCLKVKEESYLTADRSTRLFLKSGLKRSIFECWKSLPVTVTCDIGPYSTVIVLVVSPTARAKTQSDCQAGVARVLTAHFTHVRLGAVNDHQKVLFYSLIAAYSEMSVSAIVL